jgi:hypothetical protein
MRGSDAEVRLSDGVSFYQKGPAPTHVPGWQPADKYNSASYEGRDEWMAPAA